MIEHFRTIRDLLAEPTPDAPRYVEAILSDEKAIPNWERVHLALVDGPIEGHVYYGYLRPVAEFFETRDRIDAYYAAVGPEIGAFVDRFAFTVSECLGTVGWPFRELNTLGGLVARVHHAVRESATRLRCLQCLWDIAYGADQWKIQDRLKSILKSGELGSDEAAGLAEYIVNQDFVVDDAALMTGATPVPIRNALQKVRRSDK